MQRKKVIELNYGEKKRKHRKSLYDKNFAINPIEMMFHQLLEEY